MFNLRDLALEAAPTHPDERGDAIYERFEKAPDCHLIPVVVEDNRPVGLIERNHFLTQLAGQYGRAVFGKRAISLVMTRNPLIVEADMNAADFVAMALESTNSRLLQGFIIVEQGQYLGVGAILDLLQAFARERHHTARQLKELAESLSASQLKTERQRRFVEAVIEHIPSLITVRSGQSGRILLANKACERMMGVPREALLGQTADEIMPETLGSKMQEIDATLSALPEATPHDFAFKKERGSEQGLLRVVQIPLTMPENEALILNIAEDVTDSRKALARIKQLAHYDPLTGLPNRFQFQERLDSSLTGAGAVLAEGQTAQVALLAIDIDGFKSVNDSLGHSAGDLLLREVAGRLSSVLRPGDMAARLGGDEFSILIAESDAITTAVAIAQRVNRLLAQPFHLSGQTVHLGASVGLASYPEDACAATDLMQHADIALYKAKADGKGIWRRFTREMNEDLQKRRKLERDLREALENGEFAAHYQPIYNLAEQRTTGFEALIRWYHPVRGLIPPSDFIPIAEDMGLIVPLGEWMIRQACEAASALRDPLSVAVNISAVQLRHPGFVACVVQALAASGLPAHRLELEVTESALMEDEAQVLKSMRQLRGLGLRIALDDFGTGFASLSYLQRFPFDRIKIDKSFTGGLPCKPASVAIVSAVTAMAAGLGMTTTVEGVETEEQMEAVKRFGCTEAQGFLIGHPMARPAEFKTPPLLTQAA